MTRNQIAVLAMAVLAGLAWLDYAEHQTPQRLGRAVTRTLALL